MNMSTTVLDLEQDVELGSVVTQAMHQYGNIVAICSYHHMPIKESRRYKTTIEDQTFKTHYRAKPVKSLEGKPEILYVRDGFQKLFTGTKGQPPRKTYADQPEPAMNIARDVVHAVTGQLPTGPDHPGPAVWIVTA